MFRDLKEYQEIAKIYTDKVSKPEDLEERVRGGGMQSRIKPFEKPSGSAAGSGNVRGQFARPNPINKPINSGAAQGKTKPQPTSKPSNTDASGKVIPSTAEIRAAAAAKRGGTPAIGGGNAGASTDSGGTSKSTIKSVPVEKEKPEVSTMTKQGKPRTKAQMMAAKRIASGKTIQQVKDENKSSMKAKAAERFAAFKAKRAEKKAAMEEFTPYDLVLEYLLSSEQAATIEEANYVMTEMDAETIQGIVEEQKKNFDEGLASMALKTGLAVGGAVLAKKGLDKAKKGFDNFLNNQRNKGFGGNKRVDDTRQGSGDKKVGEKIYYGK